MISLGSSVSGETIAIAAAAKPSDEHPFLVYDSTFEGFLTCIFEAFSRHAVPAAIEPSASCQLSLLHPVEEVPTDIERAYRVRRGISVKLGEDVYESVRRVYLSDEQDKGIVSLRYLMLMFRSGRSARSDLANPTVADFTRIDRAVSNESHQNKQFLRFARIPAGIYVARISPKANVVPLMMDYFAARFNTQPFMIYDEVHHMAGVFDTHRWRLVRADEVDVPDEEDDEREYQRMWKRFYDAICNDERYNPGLRRQLMPKRFWGQLSEMNPLL